MLTETEHELLERIQVLETKLNALQFYFEFEESEELRLTSEADMYYIPDPNLGHLIKVLQKHNHT